MKLQQITPYTNKYSTNKASQSEPQNPNFGMYLTRNPQVRVNISHIAGPRNVRRIVDVLTNWIKTTNLAERFENVRINDSGLRKVIRHFDHNRIHHWDKIELTPTLKVEGKRIIATIVDNRRHKCKGHGVSVHIIMTKDGNIADASIEALNIAMSDYARSRMFTDMV